MLPQLKYETLWKKRKNILGQFWSRWIHEYLHSQSIRQKWHTPTDLDIVNKIVILRDENLPKNSWKLGRILRTITGKDGKVRMVELKTSNGILIRPIQKLSLLENV